MSSARPLPWKDLVEVSALFFLQTMAMGAWFVPLGPVLDAHGLTNIRPFAFAASAVAAFISPLLFGAMADRHVAPARVLRWLGFATAGAMALAGWAIGSGVPWWVVLLTIQLHALCSSPTWGLATTIVLSRLTNSQRQFGPVRAFGTLGWMAGCWLVSALHADRSTLACYTGAVMWIAVAMFTWLLPNAAPLGAGGHTTFRQRLGLDALTLLRERNHRVVFVTAALFAIPLAAFYPHAPVHLKDLGMERTSAWMTLGQITEIVAMVGLAWVLARCPFKVVLGAGLAFGFIRYGLCALDGTGWVLLGVSLHGMAFTLFYITAQIYLDRRVDVLWRARAQALLTVMMTGVGNLFGYLGTGWWFSVARSKDVVNWRLFWGGLAVVVAGVMCYFFVAYRRVSSQPLERLEPSDSK